MQKLNTCQKSKNKFYNSSFERNRHMKSEKVK